MVISLFCQLRKLLEQWQKFCTLLIFVGNNIAGFVVHRFHARSIGHKVWLTNLCLW